MCHSSVICDKKSQENSLDNHGQRDSGAQIRRTNTLKFPLHRRVTINATAHKVHTELKPQISGLCSSVKSKEKDGCFCE